MNTLFKYLLIACVKSKKKSNNDSDIPPWLVFLAYLAYLRSMKPVQSPENKTLRLLIAMVGFVLVAITLAIMGSPEKVSDLLQHWPFIP